MPFVRSGKLRIHYEIVGSGPPLLVLHGWSASGQSNFHAFGWVDHLRASYRLILVDLPGHGRSGKPWRRSAYSFQILAAAALAVLDAAAVEQAAILAYSTGSQVAALLLAERPGRFTGAVLGGIGNEFHFGWGRRFVPEDGLPRPLIDWFRWRNARSFLWWLWNDPVALGLAFAALYDGSPPIEPGVAERITAPVLIVNGTRDGFARSAAALAARIPNAELAWVSGRNHVTTIGDRRFKQLVSGFLDSHAPPQLALSKEEGR